MGDYWSYKYLIDEKYEEDMYDTVSAKWRKTNSAISNLKISKEEKKMHKKTRINGHTVHKLPKCENLYYTVEPENGRICVYKLVHVDLPTREPHYNYYGYMNICTKQLGRHGYLAAQITFLSLKYSDITPTRNYLETEKLTMGDLKALNDTIFKEEKKMTEYYVIDIELTDGDLKTKRTTCLQIRQTGNYFEIPFDGPDISEYRLNRLADSLYDYVRSTRKMFKIALEKSEICSNFVLKITTPYSDISDDRNREELCKMLTYAAEHNEYPGPARNVRLAKISFYLRECNNREINKKVCFVGISCDIAIAGTVARNGSYLNYFPEPSDVIHLRFKDGRLTHFMLAGDPDQEVEAASYNIPSALYDIYNPDKPFRNVEEVRTLLRAIHAKRAMWKNASYLTFEHTTNREKI